MESVNDAITSSLLQILKHKQFIPLYPFKTILQCVLREEAAAGVSGEQIIDYATIPTEEMHLQIKIVMFGDSKFVGTKHLVKLVNALSVKELQPVSDHIHKVFGNQAQNYKTDRMEANFIDVYLVSSCLSLALVKPLQHRLDMIIEVVIKGKVDECLNVFIRRVLEEATISETSNSILASKLTVTLHEVTEEINVYSMRERRQFVVNALKAAVLDEGDIVLECYVLTEKTLFTYDTNGGKAAEPSEGFIHLRRTYKLSCVDESIKDNIVTRCFAKNPLESVALGVFNSLKDADMYLHCVSEHLRRMKSRNGVAAGTAGATAATNESIQDAVSTDNATFMLNDTINILCHRIIQSLQHGELADCAVHMQVVLALQSGTGSTITYGMQQAGYLTHSIVMHLRAVREAVFNVYNVTILLVALIQQSPAVLAQLRGHALSTTELTQLEKIHAIFHSLPSSIKQIRYMVLELLNTMQYSELTYLAPHIMNTLWCLFDPITHSQTILVLPERGVSHAVHTLQYCANILHKLSCTFHLVETTIGTEILVATIKHDMLSYKSYTRMNPANTSIINSIQNSLYSTTSNNASPNTSADLPKCVSDLIGYARERVSHAHHQVKNVHIGDYSAFTWRPVAVSKYLHLQLLPEDGKHTSSHAVLTDNFEERLSSLQHLWDLYALLGEYNVTRLGGVDALAIIQREWDLYDSPRFMCAEAAKLRYLSDMKVLQAFQKGLFNAVTSPTLSKPLQILASSLFEYSGKVSLFQNVSDHTIADYVFFNARRDKMEPESTVPIHCGLYKVPICEGADKLYITGGVLGSDRVLTALGPHTNRVFVNLWNLPALFNTPPAARPGMQIKIYCGVALTTAMHWTAPHLHSLRNLQEQQDYQQAMRASEESTVDNSLFPTPAQVEKKRLFANFLGRKADNSISKRKSRKRIATNEDTVESVEYYASEDENDNIEGDYTNTNGISAYPDTATAAGTPHNPLRTSSPPVNVDTGVLRSRGCMELEVVLRVNYDSAELLPQVQEAFGREVGNCLQYLTESPAWTPQRVVVYREPEQSCFTNTSSTITSSSGINGGSNGESGGGKCNVFECKELGDRRSNIGLHTSMEECVAQYGTCVLETGVVYAESDSALRTQNLLAVFEQIVYRHGKHEQTDLNNSDSAAASDATAGSPRVTQFYSADFQDLTKKKPKASSVPKVPFVPKTATMENTRMHKEPKEVLEGQHSLDPTISDVDRLCNNSYVRQRLQHAVSQSQKEPVSCYVPCRIRFSLLAQLNPRNTWAGSVAKSKINNPSGISSSVANQRKPTDRYSPIIGLQTSPLSVGADETIARLVASTLWVSPEAARSVWLCAKDGEAQCILHETSQRHAGYHQCLTNGMVCSAYEHALVCSVLTQQYAHTVTLNRALNGVAFKFKRLLHAVELCRSILSAESTTFDIGTLGMTFARYICLGYRYIITSPQVAHLRGGCAYLLQCVTRIETLLQLAPIAMADAAVKLPTRLTERDSSAHEHAASTNIPGTFSLFGINDKKNSAATKVTTHTPSAQAGSAPIQVKPDDIYFEAALAGPTQRNIQAAQAQARRKVPLKTSTEAVALGVGEEGLRRNIAQSEQTKVADTFVDNSGTTGNSGTANVYVSEGETDFRKALGHTHIVSEVLALLHSVQDMSDALLHTLSDDLHANFASLHEYMSSKDDAAMAAQSIPSALLGLGVQKQLSSAGVKRVFKHPTMVKSGDCLEYILGTHYTIEALVAFIQRAETPVNVALSDPAFRHNINNVAQLKKFKIAAAAVINSAGDSNTRHFNLRRVVELSHTLSKEEQGALKNVVRGSTLPALHYETPTAPSKMDGTAPTQTKPTAGASAFNTATSISTNDEAVRSNGDAAVAGVTAPPGMHKSASMKRFKASAEVIKMMLDGAAAGSASSDANNLTTENPTAATSTNSASATATGGENIPLEDRARVHRVLNALAKKNNDKGVAGLFKKLNLQLNNSASSGTLGEKADPSGEDRRLSKDSPAVSNTNSTASLHAAASNDSAPDKELSGIKNMMDMLFQEKDTEPHPRKEMKAASSFLSLLGASKSNTNSTENFNNRRSASTVQAEAEAFYRQPVAAPLSRFHDEKIKQHSPQKIRFADSRDHASAGRQRAASSDEEEEIVLSSPATQSAHQHQQEAVPTGVRVFESASQHAHQHVSMLQLLRQAMTEEEGKESSGVLPIDPFPPRAAEARTFFPAGGANQSNQLESGIERGGMLESLRSRPKPDYQQPRDVYF